MLGPGRDRVPPARARQEREERVGYQVDLGTGMPKIYDLLTALQLLGKRVPQRPWQASLQ